MKTVVIYKSRTGFVRKYAEWIAEELGADLFEASRIKPAFLASYDAVVFGGGLHVVGIDGVKLITQNLDKLAGKKLAVFASGASPGREEDLAEVKAKNFTPEQLERIRFFYLRGGFDYGKLKLLDKLLIRLLQFKLKHKKSLTADERGMLAAIEQPVDFTRKEKIAELVAYVSGEDDGLTSPPTPLLQGEGSHQV